MSIGFARRSLTAWKRTVPHSKTGEGIHTEADWSIISSATRKMVWLYRRIAITTFLLMATFGTWAAWHPVGRIPDPPHAWVAWATVVMATTVCIHGNSYAAFLIGTNKIGRASCRERVCQYV